MPAVLPGHGSLSRACLSPSSSSQGSLHFFPAKLLFVEGSQCAQRLPRGPASCLAALHGGRSSGPASPSQQWRPSLVNGSLVSQPRPASPHHSPTPPDSPGFTANLSTQTPQPTPAWRGEGGAGGRVVQPRQPAGGDLGHAQKAQSPQFRVWGGARLPRSEG